MVNVSIIADSDPKYYSGYHLLKAKDKNGNKPRVFFETSNRSAGKSTWWLGYMSECNYIDHDDEFMVIYRHKYLCKAAPLAFAEVYDIWPELGGEEVVAHSFADGAFYSICLKLTDEEGNGYERRIGWAVSMKDIDTVKQFSPVFRNVERVLVDEIQSESGKYLKDEPKNVQSLLVSITRGKGRQSRPIDMYLLGNKVSIMNQWFVHFGIHKLLRKETKMLRGNYWVSSHTQWESAKEEMEANPTLAAFGDTTYSKMAKGEAYMIDDMIFVEKPTGNARYLYTIKFGDNKYGLRDMYKTGLFHVSQKYDPNCKTVVCFRMEDHDETTFFMRKTDSRAKGLRQMFEANAMRFDNLDSKNAMFDIMEINMYG